MAEYRRAEIVSGLFIVFSVLVFAFFALKVSGLPIPFFEDKGVDCETWVWDVGQLDAAAKVTSGGHRIGTVTDIDEIEAPFTDEDLKEAPGAETRPEGWRPGRDHRVVRVRFKITDPTVRLGTDASVAVLQEGFIGAWYVSVDPGTWDHDNPAPKVHDRKERPIPLKARHTDTLKDLIPTLKPIMQRVDGILARIQDDLLTPLLDGKRGDLAKLIPELQGAIADAHKGVNQAQALLDPKAPDSPILHFNKFMDDTNLSVTELKNKVMTELLPPLQEAIKDGQSAMGAAKKTMADASALLDENRPSVKKLLDNLKDESGRLQARLDDLQKRLGTLIDSADELASLRQSDVAVIIESLRNTAWEIENAARKVRANPAVVIFGDDEKKALEADPRDDSGLRKSGRVKPYEKKDETPAKKE